MCKDCGGYKEYNEGDTVSMCYKVFKGEKFNSNSGKEIFWFTEKMTLLGLERSGNLQKTELGEMDIFKWGDNKKIYDMFKKV